MTDARLQEELTRALVLEREARAYWQAHGTPLAEQQAALAVVRHTTAVIRSLESWMATRLCQSAKVVER